MTDRTHAEGWTTVRSHLCSHGSMLAATLAISMLDTAGINVDRIYLLALTQVDIQLYEPGRDVRRIHTIGSFIREARTQVFTECRFEDADRPGRVIGPAAANWTVIEATQPGFEYTDPGPGFEEGPTCRASLRPTIWSRCRRVASCCPRCRRGSVSAPSTTAPCSSGWNRPRSGRWQRPRPLALRAMTMRIVKAGRHAPFMFGAEVLTPGADVVGTRSQIVDAAGDTIAVALFAHQRGWRESVPSCPSKSIVE